MKRVRLSDDDDGAHGGCCAAHGAVVEDGRDVLPERHCRSNDFMSIDNCGEVMTAENAIIAPPPAPPVADWRDALGALEASLRQADPEVVMLECLDVLRRECLARHGTDGVFQRVLQQQTRRALCRQRAQPLPDELVLHVFSFLGARDLARAAQTCVVWRELARKSFLWRGICRQWGCFTPHDYSNRLFLLLGQKQFEPDLADIVPLVRAGADLSAGLGARRATPLLLACYHGHKRVAEWLLANGSRPTERTRYGKTPLLCAAWGGQLPLVAWLYEDPFRRCERDVNGHTALHCAAMGGSVPTCSWLLSHGASLQERAFDGKTALLCAATAGHINCTKFLIDAGASLQDRALDGSTAFLLAVASGKVPLIQMILAAGASVREVGSANDNALMVAAKRNHVHLIDWLVNELEVNQADEHGFTALHYAECNGNALVAERLRAAGANPAAEDQGGASPAVTRGVLCAIRDRQRQELQDLLRRLSGVVLKINPCSGHNLADDDFEFLLETAAGTTISSITLLNTNIQPQRCDEMLQRALPATCNLTSIYLGEREEQQLSIAAQRCLAANAMSARGLF